MAEFNIFLGTARKSVGDVTLYRKSGRQIARVRIREIANPRSEGQSITRNYVAPVSKFYAPFADVLARSFEGLNKSDSYNAFQRTNIRLAKANGWFLDKYTPFFPLPYQLSRGSLAPLSYRLDIDESGNEGNMSINGVSGLNATIGDLSAALINMGYRKGDVLTFIAVVRDSAGSYSPGTMQIYVNPLDSTLLTNIVGDGLYVSAGTNVLVFTSGGRSIDGFAAIISRPSARGWLRSTQFLVVDPSIVAQLTSEEQRASAIASYGPQNSDSGGGVYPGVDGEVFNIASVSGRALLFYGGQYNCTIAHNVQYHIVKLKPANLDEYFYIRRGTNNFLLTNTDDSQSPADWSIAFGVVGIVSDDVVIQCEEGSDMARYLASIGVSL